MRLVNGDDPLAEFLPERHDPAFVGNEQTAVVSSAAAPSVGRTGQIGPEAVAADALRHRRLLAATRALAYSTAAHTAGLKRQTIAIKMIFCALLGLGIVQIGFMLWLTRI